MDTYSYRGTTGNLSFGEGGRLVFYEGYAGNGFNQINVDGEVDLTNAAILLDYYSTLAPDFSIDLASLFNFTGNGGFASENWWEGFASISAGSLYGSESEYITLYSHGKGVFGLQELPPPDDSSTPEPATLLVIGLGLPV